MTQNILLLAQEWLTERDRERAQIKYEVNVLEARLYKCIEASNDLKYCPDEAILLCDSLVLKYKDYIKLIDAELNCDDFESLEQHKKVHWLEYYKLILNLKRRLASTSVSQVKRDLLIDIATLYFQIQKSDSASIFAKTLNNDASKTYLNDLNRLFKARDLMAWLNSLVDFCNHHSIQSIKSSLSFDEWTPPQLQVALDFFSTPEFTNLVNAIFFYKLYPDKLFNESIHPEKLVSVRARLGLLYNNIELFHGQLSNVTTRYGLKSGIDYLFHGEELPPGIIIEFNEQFEAVIQEAIKHVKIKHASEDEELVILERLHDLERAYKFWFSPNRLIDAAMVLQQQLAKSAVSDVDSMKLFFQEMVILYQQLTTTECLDLYGYFANNDTRYLLYTMKAVINDTPLDWLPLLNLGEKKVIEGVLNAVQYVMEALRAELKNRHVTTQAYRYESAKHDIEIGRRNRDAVLRALSVYGSSGVTTSTTLEQLFSDIEHSR